MRKLRQDFESANFWNFIGLKVNSIEEGQVKLKIPINTSFLNVHNSVHGGIYASVLDTTMGFTARSTGFDSAKTLEIDVHFL